jgi:hypothetical protein
MSLEKANSDDVRFGEKAISATKLEWQLDLLKRSDRYNKKSTHHDCYCELQQRTGQALHGRCCHRCSGRNVMGEKEHHLSGDGQ